MRELRKAVLNWYSFVQGDRALSIGPDADIFAELLESRGIKTDIRPDENVKYDYVVAVDLLEHAKEEPEQLIKELYDLLSDNGILLICCRNRFGLKYICGGIDDIVKTPMQGIRGEVHGLMTPIQLRDMLQRAGFKDPYTYYLMPDANFTQAVFTDAYLPKDSFRDRVFPYDPYDSPFLAAEADLYDDIVRENMLPHTANSFLIECCKSDASSCKRAVYAALSTDRGPEHGFATILYSDGSACKAALWPDGRENLQRLYDNLEALKKRGIPVIEQKMTKEGIEMPLISDMQLMEYLRKQVISGDRDTFLNVFRQIEQDVLASSDACSITEEEARTRWGVRSSSQMGTILKTGYIDMIPYNGFFTEGRIMYYDQEFTLQSCPLRYILFRAIRYTWIHIPEAENLIRMEEIKELFSLTDLWDVFMEQENRFVSKNRNWKRYSKIYGWTNIDHEAIEERANKLIEPSLIDRVHEVQLNLLKQVDSICRQNGIRYMAVHGTLLGAVRHNGFVPWDDDVDVAMLREDYEAFISACKEQLDKNYFLQTAESDPSCFYGGCCKLRDSRTSAIDYRNAGKDCNQGIWIDILPLDHCPENEQKRRKLQKKISFWQRIRLAHLYRLWTNALGDVRGGEVSLYYILRKFISQEKTLHKLQRLYRSCPPEGYRSILAGYYGNRQNRNVYPEQECRELIEMHFEDLSIMVPASYDKWLSERYGENYKSIPDPKDRHGHGGILFDPETPYKEKLKENQ